MIYLDYAATTPVHEEIAKTYTQLIQTKFANPDSLHKLGMDNDRLMAKSRTLIAEMLNVKYDEVIFTSGASESNNTAIKGCAFYYANRGKHIITTSLEHSSVLETFKQLEKYFGYEVTYIGNDVNGNIDLDLLKKSIRKDTILVSFMYVNNEVGYINPINDIVKVIKEANPLTKIHCDMVQALGKIPCDLSNVDLASFSAHKIYGVKGSGLLIKKSDCQIMPLICGGQQEFYLRAGTSNVCTNIVLAKTMRLALDHLKEKYDYVKGLNQYLRSCLDVEGIHINTPENGSPYILNISLIGYKPEVFVHELEKYEIYVSTRSACSTKDTNVSHVLKNMGFDEKIASSAIRISLSSLTKKEELDIFINALFKTMNTIKKQR